MSFFSLEMRKIVGFFCMGILVFTGSVSGGFADQADSDLFKVLQFRNIGPALTSGRIAEIDVVESDPDIIYVATATGGAWKSINRGTTWKPIFENRGSASLGSIVVAPSNPNVVWLGSGESWEWRSVSWGDGVYKSEDGGKTCQHMGLEGTRHIGRMVIHPEDPNIVYVAGIGALWGPNEERGLFKTIDGGKTWDKVLFISKYTGIVDVIMDPRNPDVLYAAAFQRERRNWSFLGGGPEGGIFKSTDAGENWVKLTNGLPKGDVGRIGLAICRCQPDIVYAGINARPNEAGLYRSNDRGASWGRQGRLSSSKLRCDPTNPERVYLLRDGNSVSEDGGKTFQYGYKGSTVHVDQQALWIDPNNPDHLVIGNDGGVYITFDRGKNWDFVNNLPVAQFYTVSVDNQEPFYYVYGGTQDNNTFGGPSGTRNIDGIVNDDWYMTVGGDGFYVKIDPDDPTIVYSESQYGRLVRFDTRTGERHLIQPQPPEGEKYRWNWSSPLLISHYDKKTLYFAANKVFQSPNRGDTWKIISPDLSRQLDHFELPMQGKIQPLDAIMLHRATSDYGNITTMSESPLKAGLLAVGTDDGLISITRDNGANWTTFDKFPGVPVQTRVSRVVLSAHTEGVLYATFDGHKDNNFLPYVIKSTDFGNTWTSITGNLPEFGSTRVIVEHPQNPNLLFVGTEFKLFFSITGGVQWINLKNNFPIVPVHDIVIQTRENDLVLGTHGRGFWILDDISILEELTPEKLDSDYFLAKLRPTMQMHRFNRGRNALGDRFYKAPNPPDGAIITYYINPDVMTGADQAPIIAVDILDNNGELIRRLEPLQGKKGLGIQRLIWDMRHQMDFKIPSDSNLGLFRRAPRGPFVLPGEYQVRLRVGKSESIQNVEIRGDSAIAISAEDRKFWHSTLQNLNKTLGTVVSVLTTLNQVENQLKSIQDALKAFPDAPESLASDTKEIASKTKSIRAEMLGSGESGGATLPGRPPVASLLRQLYSTIEASTARPTDDQIRLLAESHEKLGNQVSILNQLISESLPALHIKLDENGIFWTPGRAILVPIKKK